MVKTFSLVVVFLLLCASAAAETDPFLGKWKLDVRHSKYPAGNCPKSMVIEMQPAEQGVWYHSDTVYINGTEAHAQYTAEYDGKEVIVMSARGLMLPVSLKRIDARVVLASYARGMQVVATSKRIVSRDGKLMTITTVSNDSSGKPVTTVGVYTRE
jgi:hypothetical protein